MRDNEQHHRQPQRIVDNRLAPTGTRQSHKDSDHNQPGDYPDKGPCHRISSTPVKSCPKKFDGVTRGTNGVRPIGRGGSVVGSVGSPVTLGVDSGVTVPETGVLAKPPPVPLVRLALPESVSHSHINLV